MVDVWEWIYDMDLLDSLCTWAVLILVSLILWHRPWPLRVYACMGVASCKLHGTCTPYRFWSVSATLADRACLDCKGYQDSYLPPNHSPPSVFYKEFLFLFGKSVQSKWRNCIMTKKFWFEKFTKNDMRNRIISTAFNGWHRKCITGDNCRLSTRK